MSNYELKTNYPIRVNKYWNFVRATPATYLLFVIILFLGNPNKLTLYLLICYITASLSVPILKEMIFKPIYMLFGKESEKLPLFGYGRRPTGATDCGAFLKFDNKPALSFGMPSGHSQLTWMVATYLICNLHYNNQIFEKNEYLKKHKKHKKYLKIIFTIVILLFSITVSYSRVAIEYCHTIEQVIIGGIIGISMGGLTYYLQKHILNI